MFLSNIERAKKIITKCLNIRIFYFTSLVKIRVYRLYLVDFLKIKAK